MFLLELDWEPLLGLIVGTLEPSDVFVLSRAALPVAQPVVSQLFVATFEQNSPETHEATLKSGKNTVRCSLVFPCKENRFQKKNEKPPSNTSGVEPNKAESRRVAPSRRSPSCPTGTRLRWGSKAAGFGWVRGTGLWPGPRSSPEL